MARRKGWWEAYSDTLAVPLVGLEVAADRILAYEAMVVHGLLQTEDYTRALIRAVRPDLSPAQIERWVTFRMTRQDLLRQPAPPTLHVVIEECALRRAVGGPGVMGEQHLLEVGNVPNLTVQVLPLSVGEHGAVTGTFHVYHFAEASSPDVVYLEHTASDLYLDNRDQVERYGATFERLTNAAMTPRKSRAFMSALTQKPQAGRTPHSGYRPGTLPRPSGQNGAAAHAALTHSHLTALSAHLDAIRRRTEVLRTQVRSGSSTSGGSRSGSPDMCARS